MAFLELEKKDSVAVIKMNNGKNTQDLVFARTMNALLEEVIGDSEVTALVIISTDEKNWSQGIDLEWMNKHRIHWILQINKSLPYPSSLLDGPFVLMKEGTRINLWRRSALPADPTSSAGPLPDRADGK